MATDVNTQSAEVAKMAEQWPIIEALMGGTPAMRAAGESLLPKWPNEEQASYDARLKTATLFPAYRRTVSVMSGKPFSKPLQFSKETPPQLVEWANDIDLQGVNLHTFSSEMFQECFYGLAGILVEAPKAIKGATGGAPTMQEQKEAGVRPYWVRIRHQQILGGRVEFSGGKTRIMLLRIAEEAMKPDGEYGEKCVPQVRVLTPGRWELQEEVEEKGKKVWKVVEEGFTGVPFVPFVPLYGVRKAFLVGEPPLRELAYLNAKHWQSQSDQDTILHVARVPILFAKGLGENAITVGAATAVKADMEYSDIKFVEHSGKAIQAGKESIADLEQQMIQSGAELLVAKPGTRTATEDANDAEGNKCDLQRMAESFEDSLDLAMYYTARFASLDNGGNISLFKDYSARTLSDASAQLLLDMCDRGYISRETMLREQQRRNVLSPDLDPKTELAKAREDGPAPGTLIDSNAA